MRPYRRNRVASVVQQVVGEAIVRRLNDPRVSPLTTVTRVEVTGDLMTARVYLSVVGEEAIERRSLAGIRSATGFLQRILAESLSMRQTPELRFDIDERAKHVRRTMALLAENRRQDPTLAEPPVDEAGEAVDEAPPVDDDERDEHA